MPVRLPGGALKSVKPTAAEVEAAKEVLTNANKRELASKRASFANWLKANKAENGEILGTKNMDRREYLTAFLVLQMRAKNTTKQVNGIQEHSVAKARKSTV
jgi:hypothetical protein